MKLDTMNCSIPWRFPVLISRWLYFVDGTHLYLSKGARAEFCLHFVGTRQTYSNGPVEGSISWSLVDQLHPARFRNPTNGSGITGSARPAINVHSRTPSIYPSHNQSSDPTCAGRSLNGYNASNRGPDDQYGDKVERAREKSQKIDSLGRLDHSMHSRLHWAVREAALRIGSSGSACPPFTSPPPCRPDLALSRWDRIGPSLHVSAPKQHLLLRKQQHHPCHLRLP